MYHRFNENEYPSTNIRMDVFKNKLNLLKKIILNLLIPMNSIKISVFLNKKKNYTIDDGFSCFKELGLI